MKGTTGKRPFIVKFDSLGNVKWAKATGGLKDDIAYAVAADKVGNVIVAGSFKSPTIGFDGISLQNSDTVGTSDLFVVKYDFQGNVLWAKNANSKGDESATAITVDGIGNIFLGGTFSQAGTNFDSYTLTSEGKRDIFLLKLNPSGNILWARREGGIFDDIPKSLALDFEGNLLMAGNFGDSPSWPFTSTISVGGSVFLNRGGSDILIVKYTNSGQVIWAQAAGGVYEDRPTQIVSDFMGNVIITGFFNSPTLKFSNSTDSVINPNIHIVSNMFLLKYQSSGAMLWNRGANFANDKYAMGYSVCPDNIGNIYLAGSFGGIANFNGISLSSNGYNDLFIVKYNSSGNALWGQSTGSSGYEDARGIYLTRSQQIYLIGHFQSDVDFDFGSGNYTVSGNSIYSEVFVARYTSSVLPLKLLSLKVSVNKKAIQLHWQTTEEGKISRYEIERSTKGKPFLKVGSINSLQNSPSIANYNYTDYEIPEGKILYRLKIIDENEKFVYSEVRHVYMGNFNTNTILLQPNPVSDFLQIRLNCQSCATIIEIVDASGNLVEQRPFQTKAEMMTIDVRNLKAGTYFLRIAGFNFQANEEFIKL